MPMRLLAVADVYEALTSDRPYRPARTSDDALAIMRADVPARLDREAWATLERLLADGAGAPPGLRGRFDARRAEAVLDPESR
jgi:HD-GYP domain-containing protein (c-di-GMP phosphodiesterase class II)